MVCPCDLSRSPISYMHLWIGNNLEIHWQVGLNSLGPSPSFHID